MSEYEPTCHTGTKQGSPCIVLFKQIYGVQQV